MYRKKIDENWEAYIELLAGAVAIPSVKGAALPEAPFGAQTKEVLSFVMAKAQDYGFETKIIKNAVGYAQLGVDDADYIGILGHLDVVAAEEKTWLSPAFELTRREGMLFGRGVLDNKGPILSCLFALKLLKDAGVPLKKTIRILFGTDEESGSNDLPLYLSEELPPSFGFTPDCKFPVVYGERGLVAVDLVTSFSDELELLSDFSGAMARDFVPDDLAVKFLEESFSAKGVRVPSNAPDQGENAITFLAKLLSENLPKGRLNAYFTWLVDVFHLKHFGEGAGLNFEDEASGSLILTPYRISKRGKELHLELSIRYPVSVNEIEVLEVLQQHLFEQSELKVLRRLPGVLFEKNRPEITQLSDIYGQMTGLEATPVTTTGATYARFMPNIVAFGPSFPGQKGIAHKENEYMIEEELKVIMEIYMRAIVKLCQ